MTLQECMKSGKPFKRPCWRFFIRTSDVTDRNLKKDDKEAQDYVTKEDSNGQEN